MISQLEMAHPDTQQLSLYSDVKCYGVVSWFTIFYLNWHWNHFTFSSLKQNESVYNCSVAYLSWTITYSIFWFYFTFHSLSLGFVVLFLVPFHFNIKINKFTAINQQKLSQCVFALVVFLFHLFFEVRIFRDDVQFCRWLFELK